MKNAHMENFMHEIGGFMVLPFKAIYRTPVHGERIDFSTKLLEGKWDWFK